MKKEKTEKDSKKKKRLKDKIKVNSKNEKQYSITLKGYEKARAETLEIAGIKAERLGIKTAYETSKNPKVLELKSDMAYYENKIHEKVLELRAFRTELDNLEKELEEIYSYQKLKEKVIKAVLPYYNEFLEKGYSDLTKDFYSRSSSFYTDLDIIRMKYKLDTYEEFINIFDEYLEELSEKTALETSINPIVEEE